MILLCFAFINSPQVSIQIKSKCSSESMFSSLELAPYPDYLSLPLSVINYHSHCVGHKSAVPLALAIGANQWETPHSPVRSLDALRFPSTVIFVLPHQTEVIEKRIASLRK